MKNLMFDARLNRPALGTLAIVVVAFAFGTTSTAFGDLVIQDESVNADMPNSNGPYTVGFEEPGPDADGRYGLDFANNDLIWSPNLTGTYDVSVSWVVNNNHSVDATYYFDADGPGGTPEVQLLFSGNTGIANTINQKLFTDGATGQINGLEWSGFYAIASGLELNPASIFRAEGSFALSSGPWSFNGGSAAVPEPSALLCVGLVGFGLATWQTFKPNPTDSSVNE